MDKCKRPGPKTAMWGVLVAFLLILLVLYFVQYRQGPSNDQLNLILQKQAVLSRMRANLLKSVEAEKSAVLAESEPASQPLADQARGLALAVEQDRLEYHRLLDQDKRPEEVKLLAEFDAAWKELRKLDAEILDLATNNTNLRASGLSRGEATRQINDFEQDLDRMEQAQAGQPGAAKVNLLAGRAVAAALHILVLHSPHIAAAKDSEMDQIEESMRIYATTVDQCLEQLGTPNNADGREDLRRAKTAFAAFIKTNAEIIRLSRMNNSIRSIELSLGRKRLAAALCDDALAALQASVQSLTFKATR